MKYKKLKIHGAYEFKFPIKKDKRGFFFRSFCKKDFSKITKNFNPVQESISFNKQTGTIRGLHMQDIKIPERKIVRVIKGKIFDVVVDIRKNSPSYLKWCSIVLNEHENNGILIPAGCLHGYMTLTKDTTIHYMMDNFFKTKTIKINYKDPMFNIKWPKIKNIVISKSDKNANFFREK